MAKKMQPKGMMEGKSKYSQKGKMSVNKPKGEKGEGEHMYFNKNNQQRA